MKPTKGGIPAMDKNTIVQTNANVLLVMYILLNSIIK
jgi:hypothetical protein